MAELRVGNFCITKTTYADKAEAVIGNLERGGRDRDKLTLTTSQIRNILARSNEIYNIVKGTDKIDEDLQAKIRYLEVRLSYDSGRERAVKDLCEKAKLRELVKEIKDDKDNFLLFHSYLESIVAYHRFYGGKD